VIVGTVWPNTLHTKRGLLFGDKRSLSLEGTNRRVRAVTVDSDLELRHLRTFAVVAERQSFTRAAEDLHLAQQAVSQHIKALERSLGVTLLRRTTRHVELTAEGTVFLADCRRVLAAADRAARRVKAAARGEAGTLRLAYTLTTAWETTPTLLARLNDAYPQIKVEAREVFGADIAGLLLDDRYDLALAPMTSYPRALRCQPLRRERLRVALSTNDPLARRRHVKLSTLADRSFEVWPRDMAPGFYDAVVGTCRVAGFEPKLDERATGNTVWGNLARGRGVALINASLAEQLPRGVTLVELVEPAATLTYEAVWHHDPLPVVERSLEVAAQLAKQVDWL
jgi:DNA-binding transcriptional LysR family regulator